MVVDSLAEEFDIVDIAAAAVKALHLATEGDSEERDLPAPAAARGALSAGRRPARARRASGRATTAAR